MSTHSAPTTAYLRALAQQPPRFRLGRTMQTRGIVALDLGEEVCDLLMRHERGDWGDLDAEDRQTNEAAIRPNPEECSRILSAYQTAGGVKVWIITEHDRSVTTVLLPEEY